MIQTTEDFSFCLKVSLDLKATTVERKRRLSECVTLSKREQRFDHAGLYWVSSGFYFLLRAPAEDAPGVAEKIKVCR